MNTADPPVLIAYDGSDTAGRAVREAAKLFGSRPVLVVTVWEPALAYEAEIPMAGLDIRRFRLTLKGRARWKRSFMNAPVGPHKLELS